MKSQHIPMTIDEFHAMPWKLGWKHEYWDGKAHISPSMMSVVTTVVAVEPRSVLAPCEVRPAQEADLPRMIPAYFAAFKETIDYCDWRVARIRQAAEDNLRGFFAGKRGRVLSASHVALYRKRVVGAALIVETRQREPLLDLLFVVPKWHQKGVANALVASALNVLHTSGYRHLMSRFLLGNEGSRAWHHRVGFVDQPNLILARAYYFHARHELELHEQLGTRSDDARAVLIAERDRWANKIDELEASPDPYGVAAFWSAE